jgi:hypothetical protein
LSGPPHGHFELCPSGQGEKSIENSKSPEQVNPVDPVNPVKKMNVSGMKKRLALLLPVVGPLAVLA